MMAVLVEVGHNADVIWNFAVVLLAVFLLTAVLVMGVEAIKRFLDM